MPSVDTNLDAGAATMTPGLRRRRIAAGLGAAALTAALASGAYALGTTTATGSSDSQMLSARQAEVHDRGASVMPFDLERTRHVFTDLPDGGEQTVIVLDPADTTQLQLVRDHLQQEAAKFRAGDFADPAAIHGRDMPGLAELTAGAGRVTVTYTSLMDGASLRYTTIEPGLVEGIHSWFAAQSMDHS